MDGADLKVGSVVVSRNGKLAVITGIRRENPKYPYLYKFGVVPATYKGGASDFRAVLGVIDIALFEAANGVPAAPVAPVGYDNDMLVPSVLKGIKVGDTITVRVHGRLEQVTYRGYFPRRNRMPLAFTMNGREYKAPLSLLVSGAAPAAPEAKRPEVTILADIKAVYCDLSPENLTCDGELPAYRVDQRRRQLTAELKRLFAELGREVSEDEAFDL